MGVSEARAGEEEGVSIGAVIAFTVLGRPVPLDRPRIFRGRNVTTERCRDAKSVMAWCARQAQKTQSRILDPWSGPVRLECTFVFGAPKTWPKWKRALVAGGVLVPHTARPDTSNLVKLVEDALSGVLYRDDAQVCEYGATLKVWGLLDETRIRLTFLPVPDARDYSAPRPAS